MPVRVAPARTPLRALSLAVDVVFLTARDGALSVLLLRNANARARERWTLPWDGLRAGETPDAAAVRISASLLGTAPAFVEQLGALAGQRHPSGAEISVSFVALVPTSDGAPLALLPDERQWVALAELPALPTRQRLVVDTATRVTRARLEQAPLAFRLLPATFTLSELQGIYELLLGRRLHKASFRRSLQAAFLVEPLDEWRSEGRGRPAQLFRYAPRRRRGGRRGVRFDLLLE